MAVTSEAGRLHARIRGFVIDGGRFPLPRRWRSKAGPCQSLTIPHSFKFSGNGTKLTRSFPVTIEANHAPNPMIHIAEWKKLAPLLPPTGGPGKPRLDDRLMLSGHFLFRGLPVQSGFFAGGLWQPAIVENPEAKLGGGTARCTG